MTTFATFTKAYEAFELEFKSQSYPVKSEKWQGLSTANKPEMEMRELLFRSFFIPMRGIEDIGYWQEDIKPNLPFADVHFAERVSGIPSNPGEAWKIWPWGNSADKHRTEGEKFTHTYQERFWPKQAECREGENMLGIRYEYGDLDDVIELLVREPLTRQAYLPVWFPEDTGVLHGGRVPCTLGYHLINRHDYLHVSYGIRSCDYVRHFRDDCYFTVRLVLHVLEKLRRRDSRWRDVRPGMFRMDIGSFHMFVNDWNKMFPDEAFKSQIRNLSGKHRA